MVRSIFAVVALSALTTVSAQFTIDPNAVDLSTRAGWCRAEINNCKILCGGTAPTENDCDDSTLSYNCTCANGTAPGLSYYTGTMPTFICSEAQAECITANENNAIGQANCTSTIGDKCGTLDPLNATSTATASSASATASSSGTATTSASGSASAAAASSTSKGGAAPTNIALVGNGVAVVAAGLFAALL